MPKSRPAHQIVILGGGIAGIVLAMRLGNTLARRSRADITLVDRMPAHVWKPMLHEFAAGTADVRSESLSFIAHAARNHYRFMPGSLDGVDRTTRKIALGPVELKDRSAHLGDRALPYDTLILAVGSRANDFGTPGVSEYCHAIDDVASAERFHDAASSAALDALAADEDIGIAIVGGGATGVELAAELSRASDILAGYAPHRARLRLTLIESGNRLLAPLPERVSAAALAKLRQLGIDVRLDTKVKAADANGFQLANGGRIDARLRVWAAGVKAAPVLAGIDGLESSHAGQLKVGPTLQTTNDPDIFAVGDCASLPGPGDHPVPATAQAARQQATFLARSLFRKLRFGRPLKRFTYHDFGSIVSLGGYTAYGSLGRQALFPGTFLEGKVAELGHAALYRAEQLELNGPARGVALMLADGFRSLARPALRLD